MKLSLVVVVVGVFASCASYLPMSIQPRSLPMLEGGTDATDAPTTEALARANAFSAMDQCVERLNTDRESIRLHLRRKVAMQIIGGLLTVAAGLVAVPLGVAWGTAPTDDQRAMKIGFSATLVAGVAGGGVMVWGLSELSQTELHGNRSKAEAHYVAGLKKLQADPTGRAAMPSFAECIKSAPNEVESNTQGGEAQPAPPSPTPPPSGGAAR